MKDGKLIFNHRLCAWELIFGQDNFWLSDDDKFFLLIEKRKFLVSFNDKRESIDFGRFELFLDRKHAYPVVVDIDILIPF